MAPHQQSLIPLIESYFDQLTTSEQEVAEFFIKPEARLEDLSADQVSQNLHVSKATLTRFAKKCGFAGYREFIFHYLQGKVPKSQVSVYGQLTQKVLSDYEEILHKTYAIIDEERLQELTDLLDQAQRVYLYAKGSSAFALQEMKIRFMRLGIVCEVITDNDMFSWNNLLLDETCLVIGASISGRTKVVIDALIEAGKKGAETCLMTTQNQGDAFSHSELLLLPSREHLSYGNQISPQLPLLVMIDCLFAYYLNRDKLAKQQHYDQTIISYEEE